MKLLISAYACQPNRGSEEGVGWNWAFQAARFHEVWVLTRSINRKPVESELSRSPHPNLHFIFHDLPRGLDVLNKSSIGIRIFYLLWQISAIPVVKSYQRRIGFDLSHHVTYVTHRFPSALAWLNLPFIWGPVAGGEEPPRALLSTFGLKTRIWEELRLLSNRLSRWDPLVRITASRAAAIVTVTEDTLRCLRDSDRRKAYVIPAMGMDDSDVGNRDSTFGVLREEAGESSLRLVYVGHLQDLKGMHLGLKALCLARSKNVKVDLTIVGDGPARSRLEALSGSLGIREIVTFKGQVPRDVALRILWQSDVLLFPSLHDSGGFAVLEAMQAKLPVICLDLGGPAVSVTSETGFKIPALDPSQVISAMADAIQTLARDARLRAEMGVAGQKRVESVYSWFQKGEEINALYQCVMALDDERMPASLSTDKIAQYGAVDKL